jgi:hypothetical protein
MQEGLNRYIEHYNSMRSHMSINGLTPEERLKKRDDIRVIKKDSKNDFDISFYFNKIKERNITYEIFGSHLI